MPVNNNGRYRLEIFNAVLYNYSQLRKIGAIFMPKRQEELLYEDFYCKRTA